MVSQEIGPQPPVEGTVSFDLYQGYLIVARGSAGTRTSLTFLLDTGASPTVIDTRLARKLHLQAAPASAAVLGGSVQAGTTVMPSLSLGPMQNNNIPVLVEDLSFLGKVIPIHVDGIIGLDVLGQSPFVIDYLARQIHFGALPALPDPIPLHLTGGLAIVDAEVNEQPAHLLFDTGASALLLFARNMPGTVWDLKIKAMKQRSDTIGQSERKPVKLQNLRLGTSEFGQEPAFVVADGSHGGHPFDGLMSPTALGMRKVAIDLGRGQLAFSR
jgi:predicted aspartyl protease